MQHVQCYTVPASRITWVYNDKTINLELLALCYTGRSGSGRRERAFHFQFVLRGCAHILRCNRPVSWYYMSYKLLCSYNDLECIVLVDCSRRPIRPAPIRHHTVFRCFNFNLD